MAKRITYNRANVNSTISAAVKLVQADSQTRYIFGTYNGFTIANDAQPFQNNYRIESGKVVKMAYEPGVGYSETVLGVF